MASSIGKILIRRCAIGGIVLGSSVTALALTNPSQSEYENYATQRLSSYLNRTICADLPAGLGSLLEQKCRAALQANQHNLRTVIQDNTQARNYLLFSIYSTRFIVPELEMLPSFQVETVGVLSQFFTYKITQQTN